MSFARFMTRRILLLIPTLLGISVLTFFFSHVAPGDPARLVAGLEAPEARVEQLRQELGLDRPMWVQYFDYVSRLMRGDLGQSVLNRRPVADNLKAFFPATVELAVPAFFLSVLVGIPLGVLTAVHKDGFWDNVLRVASLAGIAFPSFWVGIILLLLFYFKLGWLPGSGRMDIMLMTRENVDTVTHFLLVDSLIAGKWSVFWDALRHIILPAVTLSFGPTARFMRFTRTVMLEVLGEVYIQTARAKGLAERAVIVRHALRNALIPTITLMGIAIGYMLGGSVLVETVFGWPGLGKYAFDSIILLDYPAIMGVTLLATVVFLMSNLVVDMIYVVLDPRIEYT